MEFYCTSRTENIRKTNRKTKKWFHSKGLFYLLCITALLVSSCTRKNESIKVPMIKMDLFILENTFQTNDSIIRIFGRIILAPGWHTYWLNPGDAGLPPRFEPVSQGISLDNLHLSVPHRIMEGSIVTIGYKDSMFFTIDAHSNDSIISNVILQSILLICKDMCITVQCTASINIDPFKLDTYSETKRTMYDDKISFPSHDASLNVFYHHTEKEIDFSIYQSGGTLIPIQIDALFPLTQGIIDLTVEPLVHLSGDTLFIRMKRTRIPIDIPDNIEGLLIFKKSQNRGIWFKALPNNSHRRQ